MAVPKREEPPRAERDRALLERLRQRDEAAFELVYQQFRARLHSFLCRLSADPQLARDLSQETWLRLSARAPALPPETELGAWLFTVARNLYLSHRRWAFLRRQRRDRLIEHTPRGQPEDALDWLHAQQTHAALETGIQQLPIAQREVVLLVSIEGFSIAEVARMLGANEVAIRKRLSRARESLKHTLRAREQP